MRTRLASLEDVGLREVFLRNRVRSERVIAGFRLLLVVAGVALELLAASRSHFHLYLADIINLAAPGVALVYTAVLLVVLARGRFARIVGYISSTVDVSLVMLTVYMTRAGFASSLATIAIVSTFALTFCVILISVRRNDPLNVLYTGLLAAAVYAVMIFLMQQGGALGLDFRSDSGLVVHTDIVNESTKAVVLAIAGLIGFFIASNSNRLFQEAVAKDREVESIKSTFGRYVSNELVQKIIAGEIPVAGERKEVSVMFLDIRAFTALSEKVSPQVLIEIINKVFRRLIDVIELHRGFIDKFIGDAIMVIFGAPIYDPSHRERAVACAIDLRKARAAIAKEVAHLLPDGWALEYGIGINTGDVVLGNVGTDKRMEYTSLGDTVNVAARLQDLTRQLQRSVLMGPKTRSDALANATSQPLTVRLKGKTTDTVVYPLRDVRES